MENNAVTFEQCKKAWDKFSAYKDRAEQHEFVDLLMIDLKFVPLYNDLVKNWDPDHGRIFLNGMDKVFAHFGIEGCE